ncbi:MAG: tryptophan--tRNA ligase [Desulfobacteraceae bacterium]|nr:MAG: tryptophan--tRNA ligase [Desulfobacteraceae bacterium]
MNAAPKIALTGIKPTGKPHIGNFLGMIRPAIDLSGRYRAFYFIADYHALTTYKDRATLQRHIYEVAATWLALGLDPGRVVFFRQSDIAEVFELTWILSCWAPKGLLNRAHAYKTAVQTNQDEGKEADEGVNAGLYNYPLLMAADILLFGSHLVPVGQDQKQHIEITRDIASSFNHRHGDIFTLPEALVGEEAKVVPGIDGRKMSKNYNNTIPIFDDPSAIRKQVMRIVTDSKSPQEPKDPDQCNVFAIYRHFAPPQAVERRLHAYRHGGLAYSDIKQELAHILAENFKPQRAAYEALLEDRAAVDRVLAQGAEQARSLARPLMSKLRRTIGID